MFQCSHTNLWILFFQILNHNQGRVHPSIPKELEVMDNLNPDKPILQSPHVTLWGLCTSIYVLRYLLCVLCIVHISNLSTLSEVCISNSSTLSEVSISNFEYVYRVMRSEKLVRKLKVRYVYGGVSKSRFNCKQFKRHWLYCGVGRWGNAWLIWLRMLWFSTWHWS